MKETRLTKIILLIKNTWIVLGVTLLLLVTLELGLSSLFFAYDFYHNHDVAASKINDDRKRADAYKGKEWVEKYYEEFWLASNMDWKPYVYWRRKPYASQYVNIDKDGRRFCPVCRKSYSSDDKAMKIFVFGGSTIWGTGIRDQYTIPALLEVKLAERGRHVEVTNFGESGYVSTQEIISLILELRRGNIPDLAIFYDGVNDTYAAYQSGVAGIPQNEVNRQREFEFFKSEHKVGQIVRGEYLKKIKNLSIVRAAGGVGESIEKIIADIKYKKASNPGFSGDYDRLSVQVVDVYLHNLKLIESLAYEYGFNYLAYWQPTVFDKAHLTEYEAEQYKKNINLVDLYKSVGKEINARLLRDDELSLNLKKINEIFLNRKEPRFIDWNHVSEKANEEISERIIEDVIF